MMANVNCSTTLSILRGVTSACAFLKLPLTLLQVEKEERKKAG